MTIEKSDNTDKIVHLLEQVNVLVQKQERKAKEGGENFNIFSIMNMEFDEVKTHSSIIADLLNPKGAHDLGSKPLQHFIEQLGIKSWNNSNYSSTTSITEEYIGVINKEWTEGGRIDIVINRQDGRVILIENKIYAQEQRNQLLRYKKAYPYASILFLTLDGHKSQTANGIDYQCISYKNDILEWLDKCLNESERLPMLKGTLKQYINLIKKLTGQTMNEKLKEEVFACIKNNLAAASEITNNFNEAHRSMVVDFITTIQKILIDTLNTNSTLWSTTVKDIHKDQVHVPYYLFQKNNWGDMYIYLRVETNNRIVKGITVDIEDYNSLKEIKQKFEIPDILKKYKSSDLSIVYSDDFTFNFSNPRVTDEVYDSYNISVDRGVKHCLSFFTECQIAIDSYLSKTY